MIENQNIKQQIKVTLLQQYLKLYINLLTFKNNIEHSLCRSTGYNLRKNFLAENKKWFLVRNYSFSYTCNVIYLFIIKNHFKLRLFRVVFYFIAFV